MFAEHQRDRARGMIIMVNANALQLTRPSGTMRHPATRRARRALGTSPHPARSVAAPTSAGRRGSTRGPASSARDPPALPGPRMSRAGSCRRSRRRGDPIRRHRSAIAQTIAALLIEVATRGNLFHFHLFNRLVNAVALGTVFYDMETVAILRLAK